MISTISSNEKTIKKEKNSFLSLLLWTLKSYKFIFILYFCAMIMIMFFGVLFVENSMRFETTEQFYFILNLGITKVISTLIPFISIVFTIIIGTNVFKVYHNKRMMDMYASLPIKKITMFLSRYLAGALVIIITLLVGGLLCGITPLFMLNRIDYFDTSFFILIMKNIFLITMSSIASFSMFALISMICGSSLYTIVMFIAINIIYPIMVSIVIDDVSSVIPGFQFLLYDRQVPFMLFIILSPMLSTFMNINNYGQYNILDISISSLNFSVVSYVIYWILFIIVFLVASILISRVRKNENVQSVFIFGFIKYIFMIPLTICLGYIVGTLIKSILHFINEQDMGSYFVLGSIIGSIVAYVVLFIIFNKGIKGIVKTLPVLGISLCIFFAYYIFIATGLFGVDVYVPNEDDVVSVSFSESSFTGDKVEMLKEMGEQKYISQYDDWYIDSNTKEIKVLDKYITDKDVIKEAIEIHKIIADDLHNVNGALYSFDRHNDYFSDYYDIGYKYKQFVVSYKLKDGKIVNRYYLSDDFDYNKTVDLYKKLLSSKEIKCASTLLLHCSIDDITGFSIISDDSSYSQDFTLDLDDRKYEVINKEFLEKLIPTLKKEIEQDNYFYDDTFDDYEIQIKYENNKVKASSDRIYGIYLDEEYYDYGITEEYITIPKDNYPETWKIIEEYSNSSKFLD